MVKSIRKLLGCVGMESRRPRPLVYWTWLGMPERIRKASIGTSTRKQKSRRAYSPPSEWHRQAGNDKGKAEVLNNFFASVFLDDCLPHGPQTFGLVGGDWGSNVPYHCKWRAGSWPPEESEHPQGYGPQWDAFQSPRGIGWCGCQATLHDFFKNHGKQVKSLVTGKMETLYPFLKRLKKDDPGTTDLSVSPLFWGRSRNRSSWKLC